MRRIGDNMSNKGKIIQVMGPVVDVAFEDENLPAIRDLKLIMVIKNV